MSKRKCIEKKSNNILDIYDVFIKNNSNILYIFHCINWVFMKEIIDVI